MTSRLSFLFARITGNEPFLEDLSARPEDVMGDLKGKSVALVGNARRLADQSFGPAIDGSDIVVRLNGAPMPGPGSHGTRTDWIAMSVPPEPGLIAARNPVRILWMTRKRKRLPWDVAMRPGFYLNRLEDVTSLRDRLGSPPTTGLMMIDLLARSQATRITLFGFDFFASLSLTGRRTAAQVPHDFERERAFVAELMARDPRITFGDR